MEKTEDIHEEKIERVIEVEDRVEKYGARIMGSKVSQIYMEQLWPDIEASRVFTISFIYRDPGERFLDMHVSVKQKSQAGHGYFEARLPIRVEALDPLPDVDEDNVESYVKSFIDYIRHYVSRTADIYLSL